MSKRWTAIAAAGAVLALAGACSSGNASTDTSQKKAAAATAAITPANGTTKVRPDKGVQVSANGGTLQQVSVQGAGRTAEGVFSADKRSWHTKWALKPDTDYTATAVVKNKDGKTTTTTSKFSTLKPSSRLKVSDVTPQSGETVGVGMPITVDFSDTVFNRAAVEQALEVRSTTPIEGAWKWISGQEVIFRPKTYWPAHTQISVVAHLTGVRAAKNTYGIKDSTRSFKIGDSHITKISLKSHKEKVYINGRFAKTIKISGGMGGSDSHGNDFRTTSGVHLAMGKYPSVVMTSPNIKKGEPGYYHETVYKDVQISNSGEYVHESPGDFECLGHRNCSHGCVRQTPSGASYFYKLAQRGDVIIITGSSRDLEWDNGWGYWQMPWDKWVKGSAMDRSVMTTRQAASAPPPGGDEQAPGTNQSNPAPGVN